MTRFILEKEAAKIAFDKLNEQDIGILQVLLEDDSIQAEERHMDFFGLLFSKINNTLLEKIWGLIEAFSLTTHRFYYKNTFYHELLHLYEKKDFDQIEDLFQEQVANLY
ncbi:hypothetical protein P5G51_008015 [Virgibacillus sp. 179-BFC.A HS]|uniref:Uncharacterized protein n=1 Tax=Tigheibacillus jepli TaxID=3035914 RepID=A0ABU5CG99_9BACI|nr:hypothetical protein [Virgibacillus sp. 179-BFC.A HS]MDY0405349.1 hypothetical protein [Virgibacillus sp. 179-BFC.A HS]